jgi:hypothetical protein
MMTRHCSEEELQVFVAENQIPAPGMMEHIESCPACRQQIAAFRLVIETVKGQPAAAFDFDLESAIMQQLQPVKPTGIKNSYYQYIPAVLCAVIVAITLYIFRQNFVNLSAGISSFFLAISMVACMIIIVFKVINLYREYDLRIKKLNFSE